MHTTWTLDHLFAAEQTQRIGEDQEPTGIWKNPIQSAAVNELGIIGDIQVDKRFHGGVDKALHQYAVENYALLQAHFPRAATALGAGSLGENISAMGMTEHSVYIGDIFRMGGIVVQVSQPRSPCWKINSKFNEEQLAQFIAHHHIHGWYYRVLESGTVQVGAPIELLERINDLSVYRFLQIFATHRPSLDELHAALNCKALNSYWTDRLAQRLHFLEKYPVIQQ